MNTTHLFASYPKPNIPLGYSFNQVTQRKAYKQLWDKNDAEFILEHMSITHADNISTWYEPTLGKHVITVVGHQDLIVWDELNSVLTYLKAEKEG